MKHKILILATLTAIAGPMFTTGCEHTISKDKKVTVHDDGSTTTKEKTTTEDSNGNVQKSEETKKTPPNQ